MCLAHHELESMIMTIILIVYCYFVVIIITHSERCMGAAVQAELMYPHIATSDAKASTNATWLRTLTNRSFHFDQWADEKAFKAAVGPKGEKAIFNGDILPSPAGLPFSLPTAKLFGGNAGYPCVKVHYSTCIAHLAFGVDGSHCSF